MSNRFGVQTASPAMDETRLSVLDHLEEMRTRILRSLLCIAVLFPVCYFLCNDTINWFLLTFCPEVAEVQTLQVMELFFTQMKVSAILAVVAAYPFIAWQVWRFVAPGLYEHERYYASRFVFVSTALFAAGAAIALFIVFPAVLRFGLGLASGKIVARPQLRNVINLAAVLMLGFGAMFQLPIVVYLLAITGLVSVETMRKARPVAVVAIFVVAAMVTPGPDVISQCALAVPSLLLFEISLVVAGRAVRKKLRRKEQEQRESDSSPAGGGPQPSDAEVAPEPPATPPEPATVRALGPTPDEPMPVAPDVTEPLTPPDPDPSAETPGPVESERWYENVAAEPAAPPQSQPPAAVTTASDPGDRSPDPGLDGPAGSGLV